MPMESMSRTRLSAIVETFALMPTTEESRFNQWVRRELLHLRLTWMEANGVIAKAEFAKRIGVDWKTIWNIETGRQVPGTDMLNKIVTACDSTLAEFFAKLVNRMELASIELQNKEDRTTIETLVRGLQNPETRQTVQYYSTTIQKFLDLIEAQ